MNSLKSVVRTSLSVAIALFCTSAAFAQQSPADSSKSGTQAMEAIVVTGTKVQDRTVAESLSPIDIITPEALQSSGTNELATALSRLVPSLNFPRPAVADGSSAIRAAQLRGLSPDQVLVLINGKRWHTTALVNVNGTAGRGSEPVDLNAIPISAVERVEVLRDGASAQYGSDAIAGVVNVVLKGGSAHGSIELQEGQYSAGDGNQLAVNGDGGFRLGENGWVHLAAAINSNDPTDRAAPYAGAPGPTNPPVGAVVQRQGDPQYNQGQFSLNSEYKFSDAATLYLFGVVGNRNTSSNGFFRAAGASNNIPAIYPDGYLPLELFNSQDRNGVVGLRGTIGDGWHYDASADYGLNRLTVDVAHSLNTSIGASSPTRFYDGALINKQGTLNFDISKDVGISFLPNPVTVAFGAEYRHEAYEIQPGEAASYFGTGAQVFPGFQPGDSGSNSRHSYAGYFDFESNLTDKLSLGAAGRYEDYSDFGNNWSGKFSARYQLADWIALRGTASNGFRAPTLGQEFFSSTSTNQVSTPSGLQLLQIRTFSVDNPAAIALGAEPLQAEKSHNYSLGAVLQPLEGLSATIDAYQIKIDNRIILSGNLTGTAVQTYLQNNGFPGVQGGRYFTNAVSTRTRGIDAILNYQIETANAGAFKLGLAYNYNDTHVLAVEPNPAILQQNGLVLARVTRDQIGYLTVGTPRDKLIPSLNWDIGAFTLYGDLTRYGSFTSLNASNPALNQTFGASWVLDLAATYHLKQWDFTLGSDNVTNRYPGKVIFANSTSGQLPYSTLSPYGFNGAFAYFKAGFHW